MMYYNYTGSWRFIPHRKPTFDPPSPVAPVQIPEPHDHLEQLAEKGMLIPTKPSTVVLPSGYVKIAIENGNRNSGFTH